MASAQLPKLVFNTLVSLALLHTGCKRPDVAKFSKRRTFFFATQQSHCTPFNRFGDGPPDHDHTHVQIAQIHPQETPLSVNLDPQNFRGKVDDGITFAIYGTTTAPLLGFTFSLTVFSSYRSEPRGRPGEGPQRANPELEKNTKFQKSLNLPKIQNQPNKITQNDHDRSRKKRRTTTGTHALAQYTKK